MVHKNLAQASSGGQSAPARGALSLRGPQHMQAAVAYLQDYLATYSEQAGYEHQTAGTLVDDVLYGLGVALDKDAHQNAAGFREFKEKLRVYLGT